MNISDLDVTVDGAALLDEARRGLTGYCALPPGGADAIVLWCAATHALPALPFAPRLVVRSATKRSGKSRVLEVVAALSHHPLKTVNATVPAIFRSLSDEHPRTLIFDEIDTVFGSKKVAEQNEDLRGLLNAGFERGSPSLRCVGPMQTPTEFPSFAMAALAGIGGLPDTIEDRSVIVLMRRRKPTETVKPFRMQRDRPALEKLGLQLGDWLRPEAIRRKLQDSVPKSDLEDRAADVWESLFMVADLAGGTWPKRARTAAELLMNESAADEQDNSVPVQLLHDIGDAFRLIQSDFVPTDVLLQHLRSMTDSPWAEMDLNGHRLGKELRDFSIRSTRNTAGNKRGYQRSAFTDAWERYPVATEGQAPGGGTELADNPSEASESVSTPSEQAKQPDTCSDASGATDKASDETSERFRRSDHGLTLSDASDASPAENPCRVCAMPTKEWVLAERDGRCITCEQDHRAAS